VDADNPFRKLPQVQRLLEIAEAQGLGAAHGRAALTGALRARLAELRMELARGTGAAPPAEAIVAQVAEALEQAGQGHLRRVINATGIVLHTNLGRAPLAAEAIAAVAEVTAGYCNLEYDLAAGQRGRRGAALEDLLCQVTGAAAGLAVNNGAAAILLALSALAAGGEVIVSRGEMVEIGGGFRIPDVIRQGGARLVEVGTTNRTNLEDYRAAITPETRVLLKVHQSNFRTIGFTREVAIAELAGLARETGLLVVADLGSGLLQRLPGMTEPSLGEALSAGADLVTCSGDKLLGGPQAGLVLGQVAAVDPLRRHPLMRALRLDKLTMAALEATLRLHRDNPMAIPVMAMLAQDPGVLHDRARRLQALLGMGQVVSTEGYAGGGSLPEESRKSSALELTSSNSPEDLAARLRQGQPAVVGRIAQGALLIDMMAVRDEDLPDLAAALKAALG
jgi:L-seryl-tRNA(Ser) seleniumtransferase